MSKIAQFRGPGKQAFDVGAWLEASLRAQGLGVEIADEETTKRIAAILSSAELGREFESTLAKSA